MMLATMHNNAKRELRKILDSYLENGKLKYYDIIVTSNLAVLTFVFRVCTFI